MRTIEQIKKDIEFVKKDIEQCKKNGYSTTMARIDLSDLYKELFEVKMKNIENS